MNVHVGLAPLSPHEPVATMTYEDVEVEVFEGHLHILKPARAGTVAIYPPHRWVGVECD